MVIAVIIIRTPIRLMKTSFVLESVSFRKIKLGLAEEEVRAYVEELINQRDALVKRQEHLAALTELAEKDVMDASNLSQAMTKKAADQAKVEADKMRARAEQETDQYVKARKAEAKTAADKEAEAIKQKLTGRPD